MALSWTDIYNEIMADIGAYPKSLALRKLYAGARAFCERTEVWQLAQTQNVVASQKAYTMTVTANTNAIIKRIIGAWYGEYSSEEDAGDVIDVDEYYFTYPATLTFYDAYTSALINGLTTRVALVPSLDTHVLTSEMMDHWGIRAFAQWAVMKIKGETETPWEDKDGAAGARLEYLRAVNDAIAEKVRRRKNGDQRVIPRYFS